MPSLLHPDVLVATLARVDALRPDSPRQWGTMTPHEAVRHLSDAFRMVNGDRPLPSRSKLLYRTVVRFAALTLPMPFPRGVRTAPGLDPSSGGTPPKEFQRDVDDLKALTERFAATGGRGLHPHVAFGPLRPGEWGRWAWRHMDHHLRQFGV